MAVTEAGIDFKLRNVLSLRKKMTRKDYNCELGKLAQFLEDNGIKKAGSIITITFAVEVSDGEPLMDLEILVPVEKKVYATGDYIFKSIFHMVNAVCITKEENPDTNRIHNILCWRIYDRLIRSKQQDFLLV
jgi:hypothetical protein